MPKSMNAIEAQQSAPGRNPLAVYLVGNALLPTRAVCACVSTHPPAARARAPCPACFS